MKSNVTHTLTCAHTRTREAHSHSHIDMQIYTDHLEFNSWHKRHVNDYEMNLICYNMPLCVFSSFVSLSSLSKIEGHVVCIRWTQRIIRLQLASTQWRALILFFFTEKYFSSFSNVLFLSMDTGNFPDIANYKTKSNNYTMGADGRIDFFLSIVFRAHTNKKMMKFAQLTESKNIADIVMFATCTYIHTHWIFNILLRRSEKKHGRSA